MTMWETIMRHEHKATHLLVRLQLVQMIVLSEDHPHDHHHMQVALADGGWRSRKQITR
jgi:hypothetical protein